jgi:hypothetical protein
MSSVTNKYFGNERIDMRITALPASDFGEENVESEDFPTPR